MKLTLSLVVLTLNLLSVNFSFLYAQTVRGLPVSGGSPLGPNLNVTGGSGGAITGAYSFSGGFTVVNDTNVFLNAAISNLALNLAVTNVNEANKIYVRTNGVNADAVRGRIDKPFLSIIAAKAVALPGDLIVIGPGLYITNDVVARNVNYWLEPGAVMEFTDDGSDTQAAMFDMRTLAGPSTNRIAGHGKFVWHTGVTINPDFRTGVFVSSNDNNMLIISGDEIVIDEAGALAGGRTAAISGLRGTIYARFRRIYDPNNNVSYTSGAYWENGEMYYDVEDTDMDNGYGIWAFEKTTNTVANLWITKGAKIRARVNVGIQVDADVISTNNQFKVWVLEAGEISGPLGSLIVSGHTNYSRGSRVYITRAAKLNGPVSINSGTTWLSPDKWTSAASGEFLAMNGGRAFIDVNQYENLANSATAKGFDLKNGVTIFKGGELIYNANSFWQTGGTNILDNFRINNLSAIQATNVPYHLQGGRLETYDSSLIAATTSTNSIFAFGAQTIFVRGSLNRNKGLNPNITVSQDTTNTMATLHLAGLGTNAILVTDAGGNVITGKLSNLTMGADGTLTASATGGTNFNMLRLDGEIYNITNAGNNTTVTADWNGPHWMRLQLAGTTTISFTNCPAASSTNGQVYVLELYTPSTAPAVTIQNIDSRFIDWGKIGQPVLVDGETNLLVIRYDGTNFLGRSWQDKTVGTITSPYVLEKNSTTSNHTHYGITSLTNLPGDGSPELRFKSTNGNSYLSMTVPEFWRPTNKIVWGLTNVAAGESIEVLSVSVSGGIATIILTNGVDGGAGGSVAGNAGDIQFNEPTAFAATNVFNYDRTNRQVRITEPGFGLILTPNGVFQGSNQPLRLGVWGGSTSISNWSILTNGSLVPNVGTKDIGETNNAIRYLWVAGQVLYTNHFLSGNMAATNLDFSLGTYWSQTTNTVESPTYTLINYIGGASLNAYIIGQTNAATNHNITIAASGGATINYLGVSTNGPIVFVLYSNSFARLEFNVVTNLIATNVYASWSSDSIWPQRNQAIIAAAGGSTSNLTVGGLIYYDGLSYTNHSNAQNVTNYAFMMLPANILTNNGDSIIAEWDIKHQSGSTGTNQFFIGLGANTNIFNTGNFTNIANASAKLRAEITRTGNSSQHIFCSYEVISGLGNVRYGIATNAEITETCGITNILRMHGRKAGVNTPGNVGNHTNNQFKVWYQPISR